MPGPLYPSDDTPVIASDFCACYQSVSGYSQPSTRASRSGRSELAYLQILVRHLLPLLVHRLWWIASEVSYGGEYCGACS